MIYNFNNDTVGFTAKKQKLSSNETKCIALDTLSKKWESADCNEKKSFLCERLENGMYVRGFTKFGIKVLWRLQVVEYLRNLHSKFQKARTKIEG